MPGRRRHGAFATGVRTRGERGSVGAPSETDRAERSFVPSRSRRDPAAVDVSAVRCAPQGVSMAIEYERRARRLRACQGVLVALIAAFVCGAAVAGQAPNPPALSITVKGSPTYAQPTTVP